MKREQWEVIKQCASGEELVAPPVALIVDSPWIPGYLGISTLDYLTVPEVWLEANLKVESQFPGVIFLPSFWVEMGMAAEPSGFGGKVSFFAHKTPVVYPLISGIEELGRLTAPNPLSDGLMPMILNLYRRLEPRVNDAGHVIKVVAARGPLAVATHLTGVTNFLLALKLNPAETHGLLRMTTTLVRTWLAAQAEALREVESILVLDDIVGFLSRKDYLEFAHPYLQEIFAAFPNALKMFHNDTDNPRRIPASTNSASRSSTSRTCRRWRKSASWSGRRSASWATSRRSTYSPRVARRRSPSRAPLPGRPPRTQGPDSVCRRWRVAGHARAEYSRARRGGRALELTTEEEPT